MSLRGVQRWYSPSWGTFRPDCPAVSKDTEMFSKIIDLEKISAFATMPIDKGISRYRMRSKTAENTTENQKKCPL